MIARRRSPQGYRLRENAPLQILRRGALHMLRALGHSWKAIAIALLVMVVMERTYRDEIASERVARAQTEAERDGVVELIWSMIHKPPGFSVALSAPTPVELADRLSTARNVVLAEQQR